MEKNKYSKWTLSFGAIGGFVGLILAQIDRLNFWVVFGALSGALVIIVINKIYVRKKSDQTPEYNVRVIKNIQKLYFYSAILFLFSCFYY